jgi:hypothetical protein
MKSDQSNPSEPFPREAIPAELLEWARQTFDAQEYLDGVRDIEATGGQPLESFIGELEALVRGRANHPC